MDAAVILTKAKQETPEGWMIFPLLRSKVIFGLLGWALGVVVGLVLFVGIALVAIPDNYQNGVLEAIISTIILGILLFISLGSAWTFVVDARRLAHAEEHLIVITPEYFVMQDGKKIVHVPLEDVLHVTARGVKPPERDGSKNEAGVRHIVGVGDNATAFFVGRNLSASGRHWLRNRKRTPTSLAFVDRRTEDEITIVQDKSHGDPFLIAAYLKQYALARR
jgi:hypothetical protein